jgi:putative ABC transport system ATP-binding protein
MNVLSMNDVSFSYFGSSKKVLNGMNAEFGTGKIYVIVGESGAGKTTLLSLLAGLTDCNHGEIIYKGADLKTINKDNYRANEVGVIFQSYNLILSDTAVENVMLSLYLCGNKEKDKHRLAYSLLERVGIDRETANRRILKLSGGEQQRVCIARALSRRPDILIADEPTGNLDERNEDEILRIFTHLAHEDSRCVIIVTHSKSVIEYADVVLEIEGGTLTLRK